MLKVISRVAFWLDRFLKLYLLIWGVLLIIFSIYSLWDTFYISNEAFLSKDLLKYKPNENDSEHSSLKELQKVNKDVIAWLTVYDTNIDYPVLQGRDDLEYATKNIYGEFSATGSVYLSTYNARDFSDSYIMVYGHHMGNGAMFGDMDKYDKKDYFSKHRKAILMTGDKTFRIKFFAYVKTDAYDKILYQVGAGKNENISELLNVIKNQAKYYVRINSSSIKKVIALSTCMDAITNGRALLMGEMTEINK